MKKTLLSINFILSILFSFGQLAGSGKAYDFNSAKITVPNTASLNSTSLTLEAWIKADSWQVSSWQGSILSKDGWATGDNGYCLRVGANGTLSFNIGNSGWHEATSSAVMAINQWYHVAGTYDGTSLKVYINGILANTVVYVGTIQSTTYDLTIGDFAYASGGGNRYFDGQIDEARVWSIALTESQIRDYMCRKVTSSHPLFTNLSGYWNMDQIGSVVDQSPNGNNGAVSVATQLNSGAPIGNASVYSYLSIPNLTLNFGAVDTAKVVASSVLPLVHLYRVDDLPLVATTSGTIDSIDQTHYYGVYVAPTPASNYDLSYHYGTNPLAAAGNEIFSKIAVRATGATSPWSVASAVQNQSLNTFLHAATGRKEMILTLNCSPVNITPSTTQNACAGDSVLLQTNNSVGNIQWFNGASSIPGANGSSLTVFASGIYHITGNSGICAATSNNVTVTIHPIPTVDFGDLPSSVFCQTDGIQSITNYIPSTGGLFSGPGIFNNTFTPNMAPPGMHILYYNFSDQFGCHNVDSFFVNLGVPPPSPVITVTGGNTMCVAPCGIFTWSFGGNPIAGATSNCFTGTANGLYSVFCTTTEGCVSDTTNYTLAGIGIQESSLALGLEIAPNPTKSLISIAFQNQFFENLTYKITDINGRTIADQTVIESNITIDLSDEEAGIYFLTISNYEGQIVKRIIKE